MKEKSSGTGRMVCAAAIYSVAILVAQAACAPQAFDWIFASASHGVLWLLMPCIPWLVLFFAPRGGAGEVRHV